MNGAELVFYGKGVDAYLLLVAGSLAFTVWRAETIEYLSTRHPKPEGNSVLRIAVLASIVLLAGLAETIVVLQGIVPKTGTSIVVEASSEHQNVLCPSKDS